jgi:hypothetical protein
LAADVLEAIRLERRLLKLIPKLEVTQSLEKKLDRINGIVPVLVYRITCKAVEDLKMCQSEEQLIQCIAQWSNQASRQTNQDIRMLMCWLGSVMLRTDI